MSGDAAPTPSVRSVALQHGALALIPLLFTGYLLYASVTLGNFAFDFHHAYWRAAHSVLEGSTPYVEPNDQTVARNLAFVYPAVGVLLLTPFALLPHQLGDIAFTMVSFGSLVASLYILGVRDWRIYGVVLLWVPVIHAWQNANLTLLLVAGTAGIWRWRSSSLIAGALLAIVVSAKLLLWPLGLWLLAVRRFGAVGYAAAFALVGNVLAWSVIGMNQLGRYEHLLRHLNHIEMPRSYSISALAVHHGFGLTTAYVVSYATAAGLLAGCVAAGLRRREVVAFTLAIAATLVASPILWTHYLCFLIVPLAITRPRLGPLWLLPIVTVVCPETSPSTWRQLVLLGTGAVIIAALTYRPAVRERASRIPPSPLRWALSGGSPRRAGLS